MKEWRLSEDKQRTRSGAFGGCQEGEKIAQLAVRHRRDEARRHERGAYLGPLKNLGLLKGPLLAGEVAEDIGVRGSQKDPDKSRTVREFQLGGIKLRGDFPMRFKDGSQ